jgi:pSer/pThr/pTyr-binding forkhead associated (FHA) protein
MVLFVNPTFVQNVKSEDFTDPPIAPNVIKSQTFKPRLIEIASGKVYLLKKGNNIIGREADLFGDHPDNYISRFHCKIEVVSDADPRRVLLIDDGKINDGKPSANGTFHNNVRLTTFDKIILTDGDKVRIGHTDLIYQSV